MLACVSTYGHADMCWYVRTCADMCQHVASLSAPLMQTNLNLSACRYVSAHMDMPTRADMSRHVLICADMCQHVASLLVPRIPTILDLICKLVCVSTYRHADMCWYEPTCADMCRHVLTCAGMCQHVTSLSAPLIPTIWTLPTSWYVTAHVDMPTCADMCRRVPICANMYHHSRHLWYKPFGPYLHAGMCQHMWTCRHVPICANMWHHCRHL